MNSEEKLDLQQCRTCYNATKGLKLLTELTKCSGNRQVSFAQLLLDVFQVNVSFPFRNIWNLLIHRFIVC